MSWDWAGAREGGCKSEKQRETGLKAPGTRKERWDSDSAVHLVPATNKQQDCLPFIKHFVDSNVISL